MFSQVTVLGDSTFLDRVCRENKVLLQHYKMPDLSTALERSTDFCAPVFVCFQLHTNSQMSRRAN